MAATDPTTGMLEGARSKIAQAIRQDPAKAGILTVLVVVLLVLWGKLALLDGQPGPSAVTAAGLPGPAAADLTAGGVPQVPAMRQPGGDLGDAWRQWAQSPIVPLKRNLFAVKLDYFPLEAGKSAAGEADAQTGGGILERLAKSLAARADQQKQRQVLLENLRREAQELRLQSTMMGAQPKALVSGELVREGEVVANFRVVKIEARSIVIEREGIQLDLQMR